MHRGESLWVTRPCPQGEGWEGPPSESQQPARLTVNVTSDLPDLQEDQCLPFELHLQDNCQVQRTVSTEATVCRSGVFPGLGLTQNMGPPGTETASGSRDGEGAGWGGAGDQVSPSLHSLGFVCIFIFCHINRLLIPNRININLSQEENKLSSKLIKNPTLLPTSFHPTCR